MLPTSSHCDAHIEESKENNYRPECWTVSLANKIWTLTVKISSISLAIFLWVSLSSQSCTILRSSLTPNTRYWRETPDNTTTTKRQYKDRKAWRYRIHGEAKDSVVYAEARGRSNTPGTHSWGEEWVCNPPAPLEHHMKPDNSYMVTSNCWVLLPCVQ